MICRYTTNFQDFKNAQLLSIRRKKYGSFRYVLFFWIFPALGIFSAIALLYDMFYRHFKFRPIEGSILAMAAWFGLWILIMRPISYRRLYKRMKNGRLESDALELEINGAEMISRVPGSSEGRFFRKAVFAFAEDEKVALVYISKNSFLLLPKRSISESDLDAVRQWIKLEVI